MPSRHAADVMPSRHALSGALLERAGPPDLSRAALAELVRRVCHL